MALSFKFQINSIEASPALAGFNDVVVRVRYDYIGTDENGNTAAFAGVTPIPAPEIGGSFKPLSQLTEIDVLSWLNMHADKEHMEERIAKKMQYVVNPPTAPVALPWATDTFNPVAQPVITPDDPALANTGPDQVVA